MSKFASLWSVLANSGRVHFQKFTSNLCYSWVYLSMKKKLSYIHRDLLLHFFWRENKGGKVKCNWSAPKCSINRRQVPFTGFALLSSLEQNAQCYKEYLNSPVFKLQACWELQTGWQLPLTSLLSRDYTFRDYLQHRKSLYI